MRGPGIATILLLAGCVSSTEVQLEDRNVFLPNLHLRWSEPETLGDDTAWKTGFDLDVAYGSGKATQQLAPGERIRFEDTEFSGPGSVSGDFSLVVGSAAWRGGVTFDGRYRLEGLAGLGVHWLELGLESGGVRERDSSFSLGPMFGLRFEWEATERLRLYALGTTNLGISSGDLVGLGTAELGIASGKDEVELLGGWRWWSYDSERGGSDIDLELSGPFAGLGFRF